MASRLLTAIKNCWRQKCDDAAAALEDDARDSSYKTQDTIAENQRNIGVAKQQVDQFNDRVAQCRKANKGLRQQIEDAKAQRSTFDALARTIAPRVKAGTAPQADLEAAAREVKKFDDQIKAFQDQLAANEKVESELVRQLNEARNEVAEGETNATIVAAQLESATLRKTMAKAQSTFKQTSGLAALKKIKQQVRDAQNEAEAYEELAPQSVGESLEAKYGSPELASSVDAYLAEAK